MPSLHAHQHSPSPSCVLDAEGRWAAAVRAMVERHDAGFALSRRLVTAFLDRVRHAPREGGGDLQAQRAAIASMVRESVDEAGARDSDGIAFTVLFDMGGSVRVFNVGPHRTYVIRSGASETVVAPDSLAEQLRASGVTKPPIDTHLVSTRVANRDCALEHVGAAEVTFSCDTNWLVTQLDDRAPMMQLTSSPQSVEELIDQLKDHVKDIPNVPPDWLVASP